MYETAITNHNEPKHASHSFATLKIEVDPSNHITTSMDSTGGEVTIFFSSMDKIDTFIANLALQSSQARQGK